MKPAAFFLASLLLALPAHAKVIDGNALNDLFANCIKGGVELTPQVAETIGNCKFTYGYVTGVVDHGIGSQTITACLPEGLDFPEIGIVVRRWLLKHPERLNERAPLLIREVVQDAWPCPDQGSQVGEVALTSAQPASGFFRRRRRPCGLRPP